jgi:tRNA dimethylallyltransferase
MESKPLIVIVGPTASGKTSLAINLASQVDGEIICADSRTVYEGMDIGTAKPTKEERASVPHWGLDLVKPNQRFTAADFKTYANKKIKEIRSRGHVPFLVGGTGLYIDAVVLDYQFGPPADVSLRQQFESKTLEELYVYCHEHNIQLPANHKNKRYVIRAIEQKKINSKRLTEPIENSIVVGITTEKGLLHKRIEQRAEQLLEDGVIEEASRLGQQYGWTCESMTGNIYPLCSLFINNEITEDELKERFITLDKRLAKRQLTWLNRNKYITWFSLEEAKKFILSVLASEH